jgi:hypothetical protein
VTGFIIYLFNVPICWRSKSQKGVTLLSTEAEYIAISEAVKEIKFIYYLLSDLHVNVNLPIVVKKDNELLFLKMLQPTFVLGTLPFCPENSSEMVLLRSQSSVLSKMILIYLRSTLIGSCMQNTRKKFLEDSEVHSKG